MYTKSMTMFLGIAIFVLGILRSSGVVILDQTYTISYSIAAMCFSFADFFDIFYQWLIRLQVSNNEDVERKKKENRIAGKLLKFLELFGDFLIHGMRFTRSISIMGLHFIAVVSIIILPHITYISPSDISKISDQTLLFGLGSVIFVIGFRSLVEKEPSK